MLLVFQVAEQIRNLPINDQSYSSGKLPSSQLLRGEIVANYTLLMGKRMISYACMLLLAIIENRAGKNPKRSSVTFLHHM